jgi:8-amino-7-oxononanoate synthase
VPFTAHLQAILERHTAEGLLRTPRVITGPQGPEVRVDGRRALCLCSNNYLGLAAHPAIVAAAQDSLHTLGFGAAATGYSANVGAVQALADRDTLIFSDALNHASLIDGCRLARARVHVYRHRDPEHLQELLARHRHEAPAALVITESVFSMDGDLAPLRALRELASRYDAGLLVDEAHALGVFGPEGRGLCAREGVVPDLLLGMLGKAFGAAGGFVAGSALAVRVVENRARSYIFSTAPSPSLAAAALVATDLVEAADPARERLLAHARMLREELAKLGFHVLPGEAPVLPVVIGDAAETMRVSARLLDHGVFVHGIRPPTVAPGTSRLRVTPMASHSEAQIAQAVRAFSAVRQA